MLRILCEKSCKEGIPIPFLDGFLCSGVCDVLRPSGDVCLPIPITSRVNVCKHNEITEFSQPRSDYFRNQEA